VVSPIIHGWCIQELMEAYSRRERTVRSEIAIRVMDYFAEKFGFESDDLNKVTKEIARVLHMASQHKFSDSYGGDISSFGKRGEQGGRLILYYNHSGDISGPYIHEEDFPELGFILLIEQQNNYTDYEPKLRQMTSFKPILLYRSQRLESRGKSEVLFDLVKAPSKPKP
jgi:hypothetical protein